MIRQSQTLAPGQEADIPVQGYRTHKKPPPPRTLMKPYVQCPTVVLGGGGGSYERGTPVPHA